LLQCWKESFQASSASASREKLPPKKIRSSPTPFFRRFFGSPGLEFQAAGSGVVVDAGRGYILTNNHLVENADEITVSFNDRRHLTAKKIGVDPATDLGPGRGRPSDGRAA
jgi:S1-C subfamily serine protease